MTTMMPMPPDAQDKKDLDKLGKSLEDLQKAVQDGVQELARRVRELPTADRQGRSAVPHAENYYAHKEETAKELGWKLDELRRRRTVVIRVVERRCKHRDILNQDRTRLHGEETVKEYDRATHDLEVEIERLEAKREAMEELIREVEEALRLASQEKWPLGEPVERVSHPNPFGNPDVRIEPGPRVPSVPAPGPGLPGVSPGRAPSSLGDGLGGLISKGPVI